MNARNENNTGRWINWILALAMIATIISRAFRDLSFGSPILPGLTFCHRARRGP